MEQTFEAFVHKAMIPLLSDESLDDFRRNLNDALKSTYSNFNEAKTSIWTVEVYGDEVIYSYYRYGDQNTTSVNKYYRMSYSRDKKTGTFTFGTPVEVRRKETFVDVDQSAKSVTKSLSAAITPEEFQEVSKRAWERTSLFAGVV